MEMFSKLKLIRTIGSVYDNAKGCNFKQESLLSMESDLVILSLYFKTTNIQTLLLSVIFSLNYKGNSVDFDDMAKYFDCNPLKLLEYHDELEFLTNQQYLFKSNPRSKTGFEIIESRFVINSKIANAILNSEELPILKKEKTICFITAIDEITSEICELERLNLSEIDHKTKYNAIIDNYLHFHFIKNLKEKRFETSNILYLIFHVWETMMGSIENGLNEGLDEIFTSGRDQIKFKQDLLSGENELIKDGLIEVIKTEFIDQSNIKISDKTVSLIENTENFKFHTFVQKPQNVLNPNNITYKQLFYNQDVVSQLNDLKSICLNENFKPLQARLKDKGLVSGVAILLYGAPGTGKTETVYQIAKETNREIMYVDISKSKSAWFGESEQLIKKVFDNYKKFAKGCDQMPILLFNEADAIISKRNEISRSNLASTENRIQNIILEELEKFEGILFATTNLVENIDSAFERRFLFKIMFSKPDIYTKKKIWESKFQFLERCHIEKMAIEYEFSGGQIDNILRKCEIKEVISGSIPTFDEIQAFCEVETLDSGTSKRIGF